MMKKMIVCMFSAVLMTLAFTFNIGATNSVSVRVNGNLVQDPVAQIIEGRTVVGLRAVFEALGFEVNWNDATRTATMTRGNEVVSATIGDTALTINGTRYYPDVAPGIINNSFVLPLRAIAEATGSTVEWNGTINEVLIFNETEPVATPADATGNEDFGILPELVGLWHWDVSDAFYFNLREDGTGTGTGGFTFEWGVRQGVLRKIYTGDIEYMDFELDGNSLVLLCPNDWDYSYYTRYSEN